MHRPASSSTLTAVALALGLAGFASLALGAVLALPILGLAAFVAVAQRTDLARSLVVLPDHRRARLRAAGMLAIVFVAAMASWLYHINRYDSLGDTTVLLHNLVGVLSLVGTVGFGLAGLLAREQPATS